MYLCILHIKDRLQKKTCPFGVCSFKNNHWPQQKYHKGKVERDVKKALCRVKTADLLLEVHGAKMSCSTQRHFICVLPQICHVVIS